MLGFELKSMRIKHELSLMTMSEALGWQPAKLSKYESNIGSLTDEQDAQAIEDYCKSLNWDLPTTALILAQQGKTVDLRPVRAKLARWRGGNFSEDIESSS